MTSVGETRDRELGDDVVMEEPRLEAPPAEQHKQQLRDGGDDDDDVEGPPPGWETLPPPKEGGTIDVGERVDHEDDDDDGPPPGWSSVPLHPIAPTAEGSLAAAVAQGSPQVATLPPPPPPPIRNTVLSQMVCGSCRKLLAYTYGTRYVKCPCCKTVNYVLEEHQVGQVQCGTCTVLLMYPYGAPAVKCSSCRSVTEIGEHNKRPPWAVQQGHRLPPGTVSSN